MSSRTNALERSRRWKRNNRERVAKYQHDWYEAHREERRTYNRAYFKSWYADPLHAAEVRSHVLRVYYQNGGAAGRHGLTPEDVEVLLRRQNGLCAICEDAGTLCIDHDHKTGIVRGLLCRRCNIGLGHFRDDRIALQRAIDYLQNVDHELRKFYVADTGKERPH